MTTFPVIPACRESFFKKDCGQAGMTDTDKQCLLTNELISKRNEQKITRN